MKYEQYMDNFSSVHLFNQWFLNLLFASGREWDSSTTCTCRTKSKNNVVLDFWFLAMLESGIKKQKVDLQH